MQFGSGWRDVIDFPVGTTFKVKPDKHADRQEGRQAQPILTCTREIGSHLGGPSAIDSVLSLPSAYCPLPSLAFDLYDAVRTFCKPWP